MDKWDKLAEPQKPKPTNTGKIINMQDYEKQKLQNRIKELEQQLALQTPNFKTNTK